MIPTGKGVQIWHLGDKPVELAEAIIDAGFQWAAIKAADGPQDFNQSGGSDALQSFFVTCMTHGLQVFGWQYVYGANWYGVPFAKAEADAAVRNINRFGFDGWLIDAESEYKRKGSSSWADLYLTSLRAQLPKISLGLQSYRFPSLHPELPWSTFLPFMDFHCPQVYWVQSTNAGDQLERSCRELSALKQLPIVPTGCAYYEKGWGPTVPQIDEFNLVAQVKQLPGVLWYAWDDQGLSTHPDWLEAIKAHKWGKTPKPVDWQHSIDSWARTKGYTGVNPDGK